MCGEGTFFGALWGGERREGLVLVFLPAEPMMSHWFQPRKSVWAPDSLLMGREGHGHICLPALDPNNLFGSQ